jgi:hypothetical protein
VEDLQQRLRKYEEKEIQATLAMQQAARRVAWENRQLRALLASSGISREVIDDFIRNQERLDMCGSAEIDPCRGSSSSNAIRVGGERHVKVLKPATPVARTYNEARLHETTLVDHEHTRYLSPRSLTKIRERQPHGDSRQRQVSKIGTKQRPYVPTRTCVETMLMAHRA